MKIYSWQEIIDKDFEYIYLLGYGSLLNKTTHHNEHDALIPVSVKGYKRSFSLSYNENMCNDKEYKKRFIETAKILREDYSLNLNELSYISNSGALTVEQNSDYSLNGLLLKIPKSDFEGYALREREYRLHEVNVNYFHEKDKLNTNENIFILIAEKEKLFDSNIYYLYQKNCRIGAYKQSVEFGEFYDKTTFSFNGELAYKELNKRIFKIGKEFIIKQNLITINRFEGEKENILKNDGEKCIILQNYQYLAEVFIPKNNTKLWIDTADLSIY